MVSDARTPFYKRTHASFVMSDQGVPACSWQHAFGVKCPFGPMWCPYVSGASRGDTPILLGAAHSKARYMDRQPYYERHTGDAVASPPCSVGRSFPVPIYCEAGTKIGEACGNCGHYSRG